MALHGCADLARPELEVQQLLAVSERARRERPDVWSPYNKALAEVRRAVTIEGGDVGRGGRAGSSRGRRRPSRALTS